MNKIKEIIKKYDLLTVFIFFVLIIIFPMFALKLAANDELWNFQNIYKMYNGLEIYNDANVIITPLLYYVGTMFCKVFGASILSIRILNVLICSAFSTLIYYFFKNMKIVKFRSLIYSTVTCLPLLLIYLNGISYNVLVTVFYIFASIICMNEEKINSKLYTAIQGVMVFIIFLTKQNMGIYYILAITVLDFLKYKKDFFGFFKSVLAKAIIYLSITFIYFLTLHSLGKLGNFINYTFLGINEFSRNNAIDIYSIYNFGIILTVLTIAIMTIKFKENAIEIKVEEKKNIIKLSVLGFFMIFLAYPIINLYHSILGSVLIYILAIYLFEIIFLRKFPVLKKIVIFIGYFLIFITVVFSIAHLLIYACSIKSNNMNEINVYKGILVEKDLKIRINNMLDYIEKTEESGKKVIIFSDKAALYMLPLKKSNKAMDLPFLGNFGFNGEENMTEEIKKLSNVKILIIEKDEDLDWQESKKIRKYIMENYTQSGKIENFLIYDILSSN